MRITLLCVLPLATSLALFPLSVGAQDDGGLQLTFGAAQRFEVTDNLGLDVVSEGTTSQASTRLSFGLLTETRSARLEFDASALLRAAHGPGFSGTEVSLSDPQMSLAYSRQAANAELEVSGFARQTDVEFLRSLDDFIDDTGQIELPDDVTGTGSQLSYGMNTALTWGREAPVEVSLSAGISGLDYSDVSSDSAFDSRRQRAGVTMRLDLTPVTEASVSLRYSTYDNDDPTTTRRDTLSFETGLDHRLPRGSLTSRLTAADTDDGTRLGFHVGREIDLPAGAISASVGATRGVTGETNVTGALTVKKDLPLGQITGEVRRSVVAGSDDDERLVNAASLGYSQTLTRLASLNLYLSYVQDRETATGADTTNVSISATYRYALTENWGMDLGYRHRMRDEDGVGRAHSNSIFMVLQRDFNIRP